MGSNESDLAVEQLAAGLDSLAATDVVTLDDRALRGQLLDLLVMANRMHAELVRRVDVFDRRQLSEPDGFRSAKAWLQGFGRLSGAVSQRLVKAARVLRRLPELATAAERGEVSGEHVQQVSRLADRVEVERVAEVDGTLADAGRALDPARFATVCDRVAAHLDPDGADPAGDFQRRSLTLAPAQGMLVLRGQLDAEGGAAVATALDALLAPPAEDDERSAGQRRADALVELARRQLSAGTLPTVGGQRPQVGVLLYPQALSPDTLAKLAEAHRDDAAGARLRQLAGDTGPSADTDWTRPGAVVDAGERFAAGSGRASDELRRGLDVPDRGNSPATPDGGPEAQEGVPAALRPSWSASGWADPPWLSWVGPVPPAVAQRIACDADIWRIILDPRSGMPLDVGRGYRLVPHWIRRALHTRDRGCRWPGCTAPAEWTDAHHLECWADGGETAVDRCLLLCRFHHGLVHEGGWSIDLDARTGEVRIARPGGIPYLLPRAPATSWNGPASQAA